MEKDLAVILRANETNEDQTAMTVESICDVPSG
jgi:hypothetical protein